MVKLLEGYGPTLGSKKLIPSSTSSYAIIFSSNSCLKWSGDVCGKATYFCSIDGELRRVSIKESIKGINTVFFISINAFIKTETHIILSEKPAFFEDANRDCILRNGFLSKFC